MVTKPEPLALQEDDLKALQAIALEVDAIQAWVALVSKQGEKRLQENQVAQRELWQTLNEKYDLDIQHVHWSLSQDGKTIIPIQAVFEQRYVRRLRFAAHTNRLRRGCSYLLRGRSRPLDG